MPTAKLIEPPAATEKRPGAALAAIGDDRRGAAEDFGVVSAAGIVLPIGAPRERDRDQ